MLDTPAIVRFALLVVRPGMLVVAAPMFGASYVPVPVRVGLGVLLGVILAPLVTAPLVTEPVGILVTVTSEVVTGIALGMGVRVLIAAAELAGHMVGFQMGLSYAALVDPQSGVRNNMLAALYANLAMIVFLSIDGHVRFPVAAGRLLNLRKPLVSAKSYGIYSGLVKEGRPFSGKSAAARVGPHRRAKACARILSHGGFRGIDNTMKRELLLVLIGRFRFLRLWIRGLRRCASCSPRGPVPRPGGAHRRLQGQKPWLDDRTGGQRRAGQSGGPDADSTRSAIRCPV